MLKLFMLGERRADVYAHSCFQVPLAPVSVTEFSATGFQDARKATACYLDVSYVLYVSSRIGHSALQLTLQAEDMLQNSLSPIFFLIKRKLSARFLSAGIFTDLSANRK